MDDLASRLAAPFLQEEIKWKPGVVSGNRDLAIAYVDARVVQDRLDEVLGVSNWQDEYEFLENGVGARSRRAIGLAVRKVKAFELALKDGS